MSYISIEVRDTYIYGRNMLCQYSLQFYNKYLLKWVKCKLKNLLTPSDVL